MACLYYVCFFMKYSRLMMVVAIICLLPVLAYAYASHKVYAQGDIAWQSCYLFKYKDWFTSLPPAKLQCATVSTPLDHSKPDGKQVQIALTRLPAKSNTPIGDLLMVAGGPGGHSLDYADWIDWNAYGKVLSEHFHIIGMAQRGVAPSTPIDCGGLTEEDDAKAYVDACVQHSGIEFIKHIGTKHVVADLDVIRQKMGIETWSMLGYSYGTKIVANYAERHPTHLRAGVLDGVVNTDETQFEIWFNQQAQAQEIFNLFMTNCTHGASCPFELPDGVSTDDDGTLSQVFTDKLAEIEQLGLTDVDDDDITAQSVLGIIEDDLNNPQAWQKLYDMIQELSQGETQKYNEQLQWANAEVFSDDILVAVNCADSAPANRQKDDYVREFKKVEWVASYNDLSSDEDDDYLDACFYWPFDGDDTLNAQPTPIDDDTPNLLFVSQTLDLATPFKNAEHMADKFGDALIVNHGIGHSLSLSDTWSSQNSCVDEHVINYLLDPSHQPDEKTSQCNIHNALLPSTTDGAVSDADGDTTPDADDITDDDTSDITDDTTDGTDAAS